MLRLQLVGPNIIPFTPDKQRALLGGLAEVCFFVGVYVCGGECLESLRSAVCVFGPSCSAALSLKTGSF